VEAIGCVGSKYFFLNISRIPLSDSPIHFDTSSGPFTLMKFASDSVATAFASIVLPVPEGPSSNIPLGAV
jgi:hypothetical protein